MAITRGRVRPERASLRRVALATFLGTTFETYDFVLYAQASALVLGRVFFPTFSPATATMASFVTFAVAFIARPVGAVLFGHYGDRIGRPSVLAGSLLLTGASSLAIGLLPGYATIGFAAPMILVLLRFLQGVGLGGAWAGAVLLATEHAVPRRRAGYASFTQMGASMGPLLASVAMLTLTATLSGPAYRSWGWRVPFLIGGALILVAAYVWRTIAESPLFVREVAARADATNGERTAGGGVRAPVWNVVRRRPRTLLLAAGSLLTVYLLAYIVNTFVLSYGVSLGISRTTLLAANLTALGLNLLAIPAFAWVSDRTGRRPLCLAGAIAAILWAYPMFALVQTRMTAGVVLAFIGGVLISSMIFTPMAAYLPELFETRWRYSGVAIASNTAAILGGGLGPIIATALVTVTGAVWPVSAYVAAIAAITLLCVLALPETYRRSLAAAETAEI